MAFSVHITTPRPSRESLIKMLRIPKARQKELLAIMREPETSKYSAGSPTEPQLATLQDQTAYKPASTERILIVTEVEGARNCAAVVAAQLGMEVEVADRRKTALEALRRREFTAVVVDETIAECDPASAEAIWEHASLAVPLQINFALSSASRLIREIRAALHRRERERTLARRVAAAAIESELKSTVTGLLLHSQLALTGAESSSPVAEKLRVVADLAGNLRQSLQALIPEDTEAISNSSISPAENH